MHTSDMTRPAAAAVATPKGPSAEVSRPRFRAFVLLLLGVGLVVAGEDAIVGGICC